MVLPRASTLHPRPRDCNRPEVDGSRVPELLIGISGRGWKVRGECSMRPGTLRAVVVLGLLLWASRPAFSQTNGTWNIDANGTYSAGANWLGGVPNAGGTATFGGVITANRTITVDVNPLLSGVVFNNT